MAKFNTAAAKAPRVTNLAGGKAFQESAKLEFASIMLTSFVQDQFYRSQGDTLDRLRELFTSFSDKKFAAKCAVYARQKFGMRSISHVVAGEIGLSVKGAEWTKNFFDRIIHRPDDMGEILSYYQGRLGKRHPIPNAMKKGFANALKRFDSYQVAKYRGDGRGVKLVDLANICHPGATEAITALVIGKLKPADTWEVRLSDAGKRAETDEDKEALKGAAWAELIRERKLGYFACLRNLRNIMEQSPESLDGALAIITDPKAIAKSLVLPFRFQTAIAELQKVNAPAKVLKAINQAVDLSTANVPKFEGKTLIAVDGSGSMNGRPAEIAGLFGAILLKSNECDLLVFDTTAKMKSLNPADSVLTLSELIRKEMGGGGTDFGCILRALKKPYDRIVILSDMQGWVGGGEPSGDYGAYLKRCHASPPKAAPKIYSFDLAGHGTLQFPERDVFCIAGFSEKIFDVMKLLEEDRNALISEIEKVDL